MIGFREDQIEWKILSVRLPMQEAQQVDEMAKRAGLNRNNFIRFCLKANTTFFPAEKIEELIVALRQIEQILERYLDILEEAFQLSHESWNEASLSRLEEEMQRAERLIDLTYRVEKQAVQVINGIQEKIQKTD